LSTTIPLIFEFGELWFTNKNVHVLNVHPIKINTVRTAYANATATDFGCGERLSINTIIN